MRKYGDKTPTSGDPYHQRALLNKRFSGKASDFVWEARSVLEAIIAEEEHRQNKCLEAYARNEALEQASRDAVLQALTTNPSDW